MLHIPEGILHWDYKHQTLDVYLWEAGTQLIILDINFKWVMPRVLFSSTGFEGNPEH